MVKKVPANGGNLRDTESIPGSGRSPGEGHGNPLQYFCLRDSHGRGDRWPAVHRVTQSQTWLKLLLMAWHRPGTFLLTCSCEYVTSFYVCLFQLFPLNWENNNWIITHCLLVCQIQVICYLMLINSPLPMFHQIKFITLPKYALSTGHYLPVWIVRSLLGYIQSRNFSKNLGD